MDVGHPTASPDRSTAISDPSAILFDCESPVPGGSVSQCRPSERPVFYRGGDSSDRGRNVPEGHGRMVRSSALGVRRGLTC